MKELTPSRRAFLAAAGAATLLPSARAAGAAPDTARVHARLLVLDAHADVLLPSTPKRYAGPDGRSQVELSKLKQGGIGAIVLEVATLRGAPDQKSIADARALAEEKLRFILAIARENLAAAELALTAGDVRRLHASGRIAILIGFQNAYALGGDVAAIDPFVAGGVRVFNFTHAGHNAYADSSRPVNEPIALHNGLSDLGRQAVSRLNDLGVLLDASQLTPNGVLQMVELSRVPVIATHSAARALIDTGRNLTDRELDAIAAKGGVVGVTAFSGYLMNPTPTYFAKLKTLRARYGLEEKFTLPFDGMMALSEERRSAYLDDLTVIGDRATLKQYCDHIEYIARRIGVDHVAIGTDFNHGAGVIGFKDASEAPNVTGELLRRGFAEADIAKIWSSNFLRVLDEAQAGARARPS